MKHKEILENQGFKSEYRQKLADALMKAKNYHGKQIEFEAIMETLVDLESWSKNVFGIVGYTRIYKD